MAPHWVSARALGVYLLVYQGGFAGGGALWGFLASHFNNQIALASEIGRRFRLKSSGLPPLPTGVRSRNCRGRRWGMRAEVMGDTFAGGCGVQREKNRPSVRWGAARGSG